MRRRIVGLIGGKRRRRFLFGAGASVAVLVGLLVSNALAVHDETFQLDGDVSASTTTNVGGSTQNFDWDSFFNSSGQPSPVLPDPSRPGFGASGFNRDFLANANGSFNTSDDTTFATGSKDTLAITPGWQCNHDANVNSKIDIMNAYSAAYTAPNGDQILYFALERNANTGDGNVGFWFLKDENVNCSSPSGNTAFTGNHTDGDLLVVSAFTNGGAVSTIDVYRWNGGANGSLDTTSVAHGVDCKTTAANDEACATVNGPANGTGGTITTPWLTANKQDGVGHSLRTSEFFEGGLNLTKKNLAGCFNTFIADTRSSQSLTATLFDYSRGRLGACTSTTKTTPVQSDGTTTIPATGLDIPADPADAALQVKDRAEIKVTGVPSFTGTVTFHLCGPFDTSSTTRCGTGGVLVSSQNITTSGTYTSNAATVTSAGRYCWRADFSATAPTGVPPSSDSSETECFKVNPRTPTLTTLAGDSPVDFGQPVTDTATLTGTAHRPGTGGPAGSTDGSINPATLGGDADSTITFTLYKADCVTPATGTGTNPQTVSVSGDGTYGPVSFIPDAPGTYHWVASYGGDSPNTMASNPNPTACLDENEDVVVRQIPTAISTHQSAYPNDSATITSTVAGKNLPSGGTVVFRLYGPTNGGTPHTALENCLAHGDTVNLGGLLYKETKNNVGGAQSATTSTSNTTVSVDVSETYYWRVTYDPGNSTFIGRQSDCVENTVLTFNNDAGPGTQFPPPGP
jgi:hypothetical protein